jgi:hypothetical protein
VQITNGILDAAPDDKLSRDDAPGDNCRIYKDDREIRASLATSVVLSRFFCVQATEYSILNEI